MAEGKLRVSILDFGAVNGTKELQTKAIQEAIDHCFKLGGGVVEIPGGEFVTGGIRLRSNVTIHLLEGASLLGSRNPEDYYILRDDTLEPVEPRILEKQTMVNGRSIDGIHYGRRWFNALIKAYRAKNIAVIGEAGSIIDGKNCYDEQGEEGFRGPHCISFCECDNIELRGYTLQNSANWAHCIWDSRNIVCDGITVLAGHDGFDVFRCDNVSLTNSRIFSGDDCIAGYDNRDVRIENNELSSSCSAFRFSGKRVLIKNCKANGISRYSHRNTLTKEEQIHDFILPDSENPNHRYRMLSFYTYYADFRLEIRDVPGEMVIEDCEVDNPEKLFHFNFSGNERWQSNMPLGEITLKNVTATNVDKAVIAYGDEKIPLNMTIKDSRIVLGDGYRDECLFKTANLESLTLDGFDIENFHCKTLIKNYGKNNGKIDASGANIVGNQDYDVMIETDETFNIASI